MAIDLPYILPEWYGAVGDGHTNDEVAVQTAIDLLPQSGGIVILERQYGIGTRGLRILNKNNIILKSAGGTSGLRLLGLPPVLVPGGPAGLVLQDSSNIRVDGLYIDGNGIFANPVGINGCLDCVIERNTIVGSGRSAAVFASNNNRNTYRNNTILGGWGESRGLWIGNTNLTEPEYDCIITGNHITNTPATGIACLSRGGTVSHNVVTNTGGSGIIFPGSQAQVASGVSCTGNYVRGCAFHGIQSDCMDNTEYSEFITITGNTLENNGGCGIYAARVRDWIISSNVCRNNGTKVNGHGILVYVAKRVILSNNLCKDTRLNNQRTQLNGIDIRADGVPLEIEDIQLTGNICHNNKASGLSVQTSATGTIDTVNINGNSCIANGGRGIMIADSVPGNLIHVSVVGNTLLRNGAEPLRADPVDTLIANNMVDA